MHQSYNSVDSTQLSLAARQWGLGIFSPAHARERERERECARPHFRPVVWWSVGLVLTCFIVLLRDKSIPFLDRERCSNLLWNSTGLVHICPFKLGSITASINSFFPNGLSKVISHRIYRLLHVFYKLNRFTRLLFDGSSLDAPGDDLFLDSFWQVPHFEMVPAELAIVVIDSWKPSILAELPLHLH